MKTEFKPPFRVGKRQGGAVLDANGHTIAIFKKGCEDLAQEYCDIINARESRINHEKIQNRLIEVLEKETPESMKAWHNYYLRRKQERVEASNQYVPDGDYSNLKGYDPDGRCINNDLQISSHNIAQTEVFVNLNNIIDNYKNNVATAEDVIKVANEVNLYLSEHPHPHDAIRRYFSSI
jgi:hypothetical protein